MYARTLKDRSYGKSIIGAEQRMLKNWNCSLKPLSLFIKSSRKKKKIFLLQKQRILREHKKVKLLKESTAAHAPQFNSMNENTEENFAAKLFWFFFHMKSTHIWWHLVPIYVTDCVSMFLHSFSNENVMLWKIFVWNYLRVQNVFKSYFWES